MIFVIKTVYQKYSFVRSTSFQVKTVDKDATFLGLTQNLLKIVVSNNLLLEVLHNLRPPLLFVFVSTHN